MLFIVLRVIKIQVWTVVSTFVRCKWRKRFCSIWAVIRSLCRQLAKKASFKQPMQPLEDHMYLVIQPVSIHRLSA
jgi:hypothetical protein